MPPKNGFDSDIASKELLSKYGDLIDVSVVTVDHLLEKNKIDKIDFCTIDTEGYDYQVFKGLTLKNLNRKLLNLSSSMKKKLN